MQPRGCGTHFLQMQSTRQGLRTSQPMDCPECSRLKDGESLTTGFPHRLGTQHSHRHRLGTRRGAVPFSEPATNGIGELGGSRYDFRWNKTLDIENVTILVFKNKHKPKGQHFLIESVPPLPSDLVMGFGGRWQFQMLQEIFNKHGHSSECNLGCGTHFCVLAICVGSLGYEYSLGCILMSQHCSA